jgi:hypothetical protein
LESGLGEQRRRKAVRTRRIAAAIDQQRGTERRLCGGVQACARGLDVGDELGAALRVPEQRRDLDDLLACDIQVRDQRDLLQSQSLCAQDVLGHRPVILADQHKIGAQRDGRFRLPVEPGKGPRFVGNNRQRPVRRIGREAGDLLRVRERHDELIAALVERHNTFRRVGGETIGCAHNKECEQARFQTHAQLSLYPV